MLGPELGPGLGSTAGPRRPPLAGAPVGFSGSSMVCIGLYTDKDVSITCFTQIYFKEGRLQAELLTLSG